MRYFFVASEQITVNGRMAMFAVMAGLGKEKLILCPIMPAHYIVNPETVGQCIGLKDKNGTKIFEGDIVLLKGDEEPYQVAFDESCFQVYSNSICYVMDNFYDYEIEVIGNIYDNPELLGGK